MIFDDLINFEDYIVFEENAAAKINAFIKSLNKDITLGKHEIDGDMIFANVASYETRTTGEFEAHREYVDIQLLLLGNEDIYFDSAIGAQVTKEYEPDCEFFKFTPETAGKCNLKVGNFAIFMPYELHMPNMQSAAGLATNIKVVVKVHKSLLA